MSDDDKKLLRDVHDCLIGDKLKGKHGLVDLVEQCVMEIYGNEEKGHEGLKPQVKNLVDGYKRTKYTVVGIVGVAAAFVTVYSCWDSIVSIFK